MSENNLPFAEALKQAQDLGYAEADPTSDVEGLDAARKIAILPRWPLTAVLKINKCL